MAVYHPEAGCPNCCEFAYQDETLHRPLGSAETMVSSNHQDAAS